VSTDEFIHYKRHRFAARLPHHYQYTRAHTWLHEIGPNQWRVGLTGLATRMLGNIVEFGFEVKEGTPVQVGDVIGWIEGFKAVSDLYSVVSGSFLGANGPALENPSWIDSKPHSDGWLYTASGTAGPGNLDCTGYAEFLDRTIDRMLEKPWESPGSETQ